MHRFQDGQRRTLTQKITLLQLLNHTSGLRDYGALYWVSGKNLRDFAEEHIFRPLGMTHTQIRNDHTLLIPHRVLAYDPAEGGGYKLSVPYAEEIGGGMVQSSLEDLHKWDDNFYSGQVGAPILRRRWRM